MAGCTRPTHELAEHLVCVCARRSADRAVRAASHGSANGHPDGFSHCVCIADAFGDRRAMRRVSRLTIASVVTLALAVMGAGAGMAAPSPTPVASSTNPGAAANLTPVPTASPSGARTSTRPALILNGLLKTASGERVIEDTLAQYQARSVKGWEAATRSAVNPISVYRAQLLSQGWKLTVDEPTRITAQRKGDWVSLTSTNVQSLTGNLPWATVLAYAQLTVKPPKAVKP